MAKVLIIDNSPHPLDAIKTFLEQHGFTIRIISVETAIAQNIDNYKPDIILLDIVGNGNSRDICKDLKTKNLKKIPIVLMSNNYDVLENYEECKADDVIKKPFILPEVIAKINSVLEMYSIRS